MYSERERRWYARMEVETFQQAGLLQSMPQPSCRTRQARTLLSMYVILRCLRNLPCPKFHAFPDFLVQNIIR